MSAVDWRSLTPADTERLSVRVLRPAHRSRPEVRLISLNGERAVVKDYARGANWFKRLLGAFLVRREATALRRADGVERVPRLLALPSPCLLVTSYLDAVGLGTPGAPEIDERFCDLLEAIIDKLHDRGIAHGDLEKLDNILITPGAEPALVDFTSAIMSGANAGAAFALPEVMKNDRRAVCKLKAKLAPELLSEEERRLLHSRSPLESWFRSWRGYIRRPVKRLSDGGTDG